jgi:hypothetical protein
MAVDSASLLSFLAALVEPSNRTRADNVGGTSTTCSPAPTSCCASSLPNPPADSIAQVRSQPNAAAHPNSRSVWHRSATTCSLAIGCSSPSIATTVWVALCGSIPMITDMEVPPRGRV